MSWTGRQHPSGPGMDLQSGEMGTAHAGDTHHALDTTPAECAAKPPASASGLPVTHSASPLSEQARCQAGACEPRPSPTLLPRSLSYTSPPLRAKQAPRGRPRHLLVHLSRPCLSARLKMPPRPPSHFRCHCPMKSPGRRMHHCCNTGGVTHPIVGLQTARWVEVDDMGSDVPDTMSAQDCQFKFGFGKHGLGSCGPVRRTEGFRRRSARPLLA